MKLNKQKAWNIAPSEQKSASALTGAGSGSPAVPGSSRVGSELWGGQWLEILEVGLEWPGGYYLPAKVEQQ